VSELQRYRRHAQLYGCEDIYEVAASDGLEPLQLGYLALALRTVDPKWRLTRAEAMDLAVTLVGSGCSDKDIRKMAGISQPTVSKAHSRAAKTESFGQTDPVANGG